MKAFLMRSNGENLKFLYYLQVISIHPVDRIEFILFSLLTHNTTLLTFPVRERRVEEKEKIQCDNHIIFTRRENRMTVSKMIRERNCRYAMSPGFNYADFRQGTSRAFERAHGKLL